MGEQRTIKRSIFNYVKHKIYKLIAFQHLIQWERRSIHAEKKGQLPKVLNWADKLSHSSPPPSQLDSEQLSRSEN